MVIVSLSASLVYWQMDNNNVYGMLKVKEVNFSLLLAKVTDFDFIENFPIKRNEWRFVEG